VWTHAKYAIQYVLDGGTIQDTACPASYTYGTGAALPEQVVREGFRFLGWYEDGSETPVTAIGADETGERTFTARWMQQHTVTFDANGAQGVMQPVTMDNGALFTLPQNAFVIPEGQRFCGWLVGETIRQPGDSFSLLAPLTVKALWEYLPADVPPAEDEDKMAAEAIPKTGDGFNMALWLSLACLSLAGAAWLIDLRVRKG